MFGLTELHREEIARSSLVANPGCYSTAGILALAPLAREELIADAVVDAKSGVSGAGRAATDTTHFVSVDENVTPYGERGHRHGPEIDQELAALGCDVRLTFTPHLVPLDQGLLATCYVTPARPVTSEEVAELFHDAYDDERFVELAGAPPGVRDVRDTNLCPDSRPGRAGWARARLLRDRQPLEGRRGPGGPEPERDAGPRRRRGPAVTTGVETFFRSRWVPRPEGVTELEPTRLPAGFRAGGRRVRDRSPPGGSTSGVLVCDHDDAVTDRAVHEQRGRRRRPSRSRARRSSTGSAAWP